MTKLDLRPASAEAFSVAIDWAAAEGWNPGLDDLPVFHATDPNGFYIGRIDGQAVSSISVVRYGSDYGFLGFYIVHPEHRGKGHGIATWNHGMAYLADCATIGLDGVVDQQDNYRKSGFVLAGRNVRHGGIPTVGSAGDELRGVRDLTAGDLAAAVIYDRDFFAGPREIFTAAWALPRPGVSRRAKIAIRNGEVAGYGVIRECRSGCKIGPLFAEDETTATALFQELAVTAPGEEIALDTPEDNAAAVALAERFGLKPVFETARMYRVEGGGAAPALPIDRTFGITTFELG